MGLLETPLQPKGPLGATRSSSERLEIPRDLRCPLGAKEVLEAPTYIGAPEGPVEAAGSFLGLLEAHKLFLEPAGANKDSLGLLGNPWGTMRSQEEPGGARRS